MKKETMEKQEERARNVYVPPQMEVHEAAPGRLMGTSFWGGHNGGNASHDDNDHERGDDGGIEYGAKAVILGQEFSFSDVWEE